MLINQIKDIKIDKENQSNNNNIPINYIKKSKTFSINKNRINNLALKYNILNYDISYRAETFRITISEIAENGI